MTGTRITTQYGDGTLELLLPQSGYWIIRLDQPAEILRGYISEIYILSDSYIRKNLGLEEPEKAPENHAKIITPAWMPDKQMSIL